MAEKFEIKGIDKAVEDFNKLNISVEKGVDDLMKYVDEAQKLSNLLGTNPDLKKYVEIQGKANKTLREGANSLTEVGRLQSLIEKQQRKLTLSTSDLAKQEAILRAELNKVNKANREQAKDIVNGVTAYQRLARTLNDARDEARELAFEFGRNSNEYKTARKRVQELDREIKDLDADLGQFQRNVGNYPGLGLLENQLSRIGISLDDISANGKASSTALASSFRKIGQASISFLATPLGATLAILGSLFALISRNKQTVVDFDSDLRDVGKTANLSGEELRGLGEATIQLSNSLRTVSVTQLLEYQKVAGQLGVKGTENILSFSEALAKLETASDIAGEEGATNIARLLELVDGGVQNVEDFGNEIVELGNNFAATENEILGNATAIAQSTAQYDLGRQNILAYATATKAVGLESQLTGTAISKTLNVLEKSLRTGENISEIARLTGSSVEELIL